MKKRILSLLLCAALLFALLPAMEWTAAAQIVSYKNLKFKEVDNWNSLVLLLQSYQDYNIKLKCDIEEESEWVDRWPDTTNLSKSSFTKLQTIEVRGTKVLDLNGHTLRYEDMHNCVKFDGDIEYYMDDENTMFHISSDANMHIVDSGSGGAITFTGYLPGRSVSGPNRCYLGLPKRNVFDVEGILHINGGLIQSGGCVSRKAHGYYYRIAEINERTLRNIDAVVGGSPLIVRDSGTVYVNGGTIRGRGEEIIDSVTTHIPTIQMETNGKLIVNDGKFQGYSGASIFEPMHEGSVSICAAEFELDCNHFVFTKGADKCAYGTEGRTYIRSTDYPSDRVDVFVNGKTGKDCYQTSDKVKIRPVEAYTVGVSDRNDATSLDYTMGSSTYVYADILPLFSENEAEYSPQCFHYATYTWSYRPFIRNAYQDEIVLQTGTSFCADLAQLLKKESLQAGQKLRLYCSFKEIWRGESNDYTITYTQSSPMEITITQPEEDPVIIGKKTIESIALTGITPPADGELPDADSVRIAAGDSDRYQIFSVLDAKVSWSELKGSTIDDDLTDWPASRSTFDSSHYYVASVIMTAKDGYVFAEDLRCTYDGVIDPNRYVALQLGSDTVAYAFIIFDPPEADPTIITDVWLEGFTRTCITGDRIADGDPVTLEQGENRYGISEQYWLIEDEISQAGGPAAPNDVFEEGILYSQNVELVPKPGYRFSAYCTVHLNHDTVDVDYFKLYDDGRISVSAEPTYAIAEEDLITDVYVDYYQKPVVGMQIDDYLWGEVGEMEFYFLDDQYWYDVTEGRRTDPAEYFEADHTYQYRMAFSTFEAFAGDTGPQVKAHVREQDSFTDQPVASCTFGANGTDHQKLLVSLGTITVEKNSNVIDTVNVEHLQRCYTGQIAGNICSPRVAPGGKYHITEAFWVCLDTNARMANDEVFEAGKQYYMIIEVHAENGFTFDWSTSYVLNEGELTGGNVDFPHEENLTSIYVVSPLFECKDREAITQIEIGNAADPMGGMNADEYHPLNVDQGKGYFIANQDWFNEEDDRQLGMSDFFENGKRYYMRATISAQEGYFFSPDCEIRLIGYGQIAAANLPADSDETAYLMLKPMLCGDPCEGYLDINRSSWYHSAVDFVISRGLMGSTSTSKLIFDPGAKVSRAMVATILYRIAGSPSGITYSGTFIDVPQGQWYTEAIEWAAQNGLATGKGNGRFDPNGKVTRQELAAFMMRMAEYLGNNTSGRAKLSAFDDAANVPDWAKTYVQWAVDAKLISGKATGGKLLLAPTDNATRAEFAAIIMRFVQNFVK